MANVRPLFYHMLKLSHIHFNPACLFLSFPGTTQSPFTGLCSKKDKKAADVPLQRGRDVWFLVWGPAGSAWLTAPRLMAERFPRLSSVGHHEQWSKAAEENTCSSSLVISVYVCGHLGKAVDTVDLWSMIQHKYHFKEPVLFIDFIIPCCHFLSFI